MYTVDALTAHAEANGISLFACGGVLAGEQCLTGLPVQNDARVIDSIHKLAVENNIHPLRIATEKHRVKLDNVCAAYKNHDSEDKTDHLSELLQLKGGAFVKPSTVEDQKLSPACCDRHGIYFNQDLVFACLQYLESNSHLDTDQKILNDKTGASFIALFEMAIWHELGHIKLHQEKEGNRDEWRLTQEISGGEFPLYGESGYAIEAAIRRLFCDEQGTSDSPIYVLQPITKRSTAFATNPFRDLSIRKFTYDPSRDPPLRSITPDPHINGMSVEDIRAFMEFGLRPLVAQGENNGDDDDDDDDEGREGGGDSDARGSGKRKRSGVDEGNRSGGKRTLGTSKGSSSDERSTSKTHSWGEGSTETYEKAKILQSEAELNQDSYNQECRSVSLLLCDSDGNGKYTFTPDENIFVRISAKNETDRPCHIILKKGKTFGRCGHYMKIDDCPLKYTPSEGNVFECYDIVKLDPGEDRYFERMLAAGSAEKDRSHCMVYTPSKSGKYSVSFYARDPHIVLGSTEFTIRG